MRATASILHLDLDAFFAAVEQRDKPSLRGRPVIVGGLGQRGVVSTASYEARRFGVHSAMPMHEARRRCPHGAFLAGRFPAYRAASALVMAELHALTPLVEPLSIDEAFCDLDAGDHHTTPEALRRIAADLKRRVREVTGGLTASVGLGSSKFMAKLATELGKPDGLHLVEPGTEADVLAPLGVGVIPGVGPVTRDKLHRLGVDTISDLRALSDKEMARELGPASATSLRDLAWGRDDRPVNPERETKSISVEDTFEHDITDRAELTERIERHARLVTQRLHAAGLFARTVQLKVKFADFTTWTRSRTLAGATDRLDLITTLARELLAGVEIGSGLRLIGVGVAGLSDVAQEQLFDLEPTTTTTPDTTELVVEQRRPPTWATGADVHHDDHGPGWVWGMGKGRITVRFETATTGPGPVRTFRQGDPALHLGPPPVEKL